jgi:hypothetical protein
LGPRERERERERERDHTAVALTGLRAQIKANFVIRRLVREMRDTFVEEHCSQLAHASTQDFTSRDDFT